MAIRIDEYGHIIRDENEQNNTSSPVAGSSETSGDRLYIHPNSTQVEASHLQRPQRRNNIWPIIIVIGIVIFLVSIIKSCSSNDQNDGYSNAGNQQYGYEDDNIYEDDTNDIVQEPEKELISFVVEEISRDTLNVPGIFAGETITIPEEPTVTFSGYSSKNDDKQVFSYTAPRNGRYRFDFEDVNANASIRVLVTDSTGDRVLDTYTSGGYANLTANETYEVQVRNSSGESGYILKIGVQKPTIDITTITTINDQISFEDQKNCYTFTPSIAGRYRFDLTETNANVGFRLMMWDRLDNNIMDSYSEGDYVTLEAGETYSIQVRQDSGLGSYKMVVGCQKETLDITNYGIVVDSVQYEDQKNCYTFTPSVAGRYRFDLTETNANVGFRLMMWDRLDNNIMDSYSEGDYITLEAGETYSIQVRQDSGLGSYKMVIGYQKETVNITGYDLITDSLTFDDQKNVYIFTPAYSGTVSLTIGDYNSSCSMRLMAWDEFENNILDTYNEHGTISVEANKTYEIQVRQDDGYCSYSLYIEKQ